MQQTNITPSMISRSGSKKPFPNEGRNTLFNIQESQIKLRRGGPEGAIKSSPPPPAQCGEFVSPYDLAVYKTFDAKLISNRVPSGWYRRYIDCVPEKAPPYQPSNEVQKRDEDIALQYYIGSGYRLMDNPKDKHIKSEREALIKRYNKMKEIEKQRMYKRTAGDEDSLMKVQSLRSMIAAKKTREINLKEMFGPTKQEKSKLQPVVSEMKKLTILRRRSMQKPIDLSPESKWRVLRVPAVKVKTKAMYEKMTHTSIRRRFIRAISLVLCVTRFVSIVGQMAGDTHSIFKDIKQFQMQREKLLSKSDHESLRGRKEFNPELYTFKKEINLPLELKLTLTSLWQNRPEEEVIKIVQALQRTRTFVAYPVSYQRLLAQVAWYIVVPAYRVVIRQNHKALDCYFMISGRAKVEQLVGDPYYKGHSQFKLLRTLKAQDTFGEECITQPDCTREWTVTTETVCEMLSINCHEFQDFAMIPHKNEETPEHIKFLGSLSFLAKFPKIKLLEDAESNIYITHFLTGTVVTQDAEKSEFVYIVFHGSCEVLKELAPPSSVIEEYVKKKSSKSTRSSLNMLPPQSKSATMTQIGLSANSSSRSFKSADQSRRATKETFKSYFERQQEFVERREGLSKLLHSELERRKQESMSYRNMFLAQNREIEEKSRLLSETLSTRARNKLLGGQNPLPAIKAASAIKESVSKESSSSASDKSLSIRKSSTKKKLEYSKDLKDDADEESLRLSTKRLSTIVGSKLNFITTVLKPPSEASQEEKDLQRNEVDEQAAGVKLPEEEENDDSSEDYPRFNIHKENVQKYSRWVMVKSAQRGDVVGIEFLDFNVGPFEPPLEKCSLVSRGATVIMFRKTLLLQYLRKEW